MVCRLSVLNHDPKPSGDIVTSNGLGKGNAADYITGRQQAAKFDKAKAT